MTRKQKITLSITGIILVTLILVGLTYGYYLTTIKGNTNTKSITTSLANLELKYDDGNGIITSSNLEPGDSVTKTFSVENTGNKKVVNYTVYLENVINEFIDKNDLKITLKCTSNNGTCNGNTLTYPSSDGIIAVNDIEEKEIQTFELKVDFIETNDLQNDNMNKKFEGNVKILDIKSTNKKLVTSEGENNATVSSPELLTNFKIYGNSLQETRSGKNLFNYDIVGATGIKQNGGYYRSGEKSIRFNTYETLSNYIGKTVTLSFDITVSETATFAIYQYQKNGIGIDFQTISKEITANTPTKIVITGEVKELGTTASYSKGELMVYNANYTGNYFVTNVQIEEGDTATEYEPYGVSPSPDYPSEIKSVGDIVTDTDDTNYGKYKIPIKTSGKNLFDSIWEKGFINTTTGTNDDSNLTYVRTPHYTKISGGQNYYLSSPTITDNTITVSWYFYNANKDFVKRQVSYTNSKIIPPEDATYIRLVLKTINLDEKIQIEEGEIATDYQPYVEPKINNIYLDEPLRKVGNYSDYLDLVNKKVVRNITKKVFNGTETWNSFNSTKVFFTIDSSLKYENDIYCLSDKYLCQVSAGGQSYKSGNAWVQSTSKYPRIYFADDNHSTVTAFKNNLKTNNITGIYVLNETKTEDLNISEIELSENTKKIFIETNTKPSNIEIEYIN